MLELLVSPPGTGKTTHCIELFRDQILKSKGGIDSRSFFILPSREHAERIQNLILKKEVTGLFNAHILTINDFTAKLLGGFSGAAATDTLRRNLIKRILQDPDLLAGGENSKGLQYFGKVAELGGFYHLLADTIKEFKSGLLTISEFESLAQALLKKGVFRSKFRDFSIVLKKYEAALKELGMKEPEDDIASLLKEGGVSGRSVDLVIFDGFYHFTRAQRSLIGAVSRWSGHTIVTLTLPQVEADRKSLFEYPLHTKRFLVEMGFRPKQGSFGDNLRTAEPDLRHLERALFSKEPNVCPQSPSNISLLEAPTVREEIQMIARQIKKLYRETDIHYSDICVVLRTIADYESIIHSVFMEFDIPVNIHERKKLIEQGFAVTLFRFLDLLRNDWRREDLLYFLKSSYLRHQIKPEDALELEALAVGRNISGERSKWFALLDASDVTQGAKDALKWVSDWEKKFLNARSLKEFSGHLDVFMSQCGMLKPDEAAASGDANEKSDQQAAKTIDTLLKNARRDYDAQGGRPFVVLPFIEELQEAMEAALFSLKPSGKNRVQVYDVVMALAKEYKAVFIAGLLEKRFPQAVSEDPLFKDDERRVINRKETVLEERLWRVAGERYFFYMACTRAKEKLYLSYPLYDAEARPSLPSFFVDEVKKCFKPGSLSVLRKDLNERLPKSDEWESEAGVTRDLSESLFQEEKEGDDSCFITNPAMIEALNEWIAKDYFKEIVRNGLSDDEAAIRDERIKKSFAGLRGPFSATRLETYATCAFKYFAQRILRLKEPLEGKEPWRWEIYFIRSWKSFTRTCRRRKEKINLSSKTWRRLSGLCTKESRS